VYGRVVGGSSVHFTANYWRFHEIDFIERSKVGPIPGTGFTDWPITYADLEPYYTKVEWEIGVSGPLGWRPFPAPMAILSQPRPGRRACVQCGFCESFGCEVGAKSSSLATVIRVAEKTGRCEIRPNSYVHRIETGANGRVTGAAYFDEKRTVHLQKAKAVVVCANGAETPRLLLLSANKQFPNGLANSSGLVGKYLMMNSGPSAMGVFEHPLNDYKGFAVSRVLRDFYEPDPQKVGFYGGDELDARFDLTPAPVVCRRATAMGQGIQVSLGTQLHEHHGNRVPWHFAPRRKQQLLTGSGS
jgi:choline dehydrogenase-like flavoprotein